LVPTGSVECRNPVVVRWPVALKPGDETMARPTELTDALQAAICRDLAAGLPRESAARRVGISLRTFQRWLKLGRDAADADEPYRRFFDAVLKAEHDAVARNVALIQKAAADDWRAAAWWLEHTYPEVWGIGRREFLEMRRLVKQLKSRLAGPPRTSDEQPHIDEAMARCLGGEAKPLPGPAVADRDEHPEGDPEIDREKNPGSELMPEAEACGDGPAEGAVEENHAERGGARDRGEQRGDSRDRPGRHDDVLGKADRDGRPDDGGDLCRCAEEREPADEDAADRTDCVRPPDGPGRCVRSANPGLTPGGGGPQLEPCRAVGLSRPKL